MVLLMSLSLSGCFSLYDSYSGGEVNCSIEITSNHSKEKLDAVSFSAFGSSYNTSFVNSFRVRNNTNQRFFIEWENARCNFGKVVFGDDRRISMNNPKADEAVSAYSSSLSRELTSMSNIGDESVYSLYHVKNLKNGQTESVYLNIPIRFSDGSVEEYHLTLKYSWKAKQPTNN